MVCMPLSPGEGWTSNQIFKKEGGGGGTLRGGLLEK